MNIPEDFLTKIIKESNFPLFLINCGSFPTENNFNNILENDDLNTVLNLLKYKLILIHKKKLKSYNIDIQKLCNRIPKNDLILLHNILFYSLLIESNFDNIFKYLNQSCNFITSKQNIDINLILHHLEIIDVVLEICKLLKITETKTESICDLILNLIVCDDNNIRRKISADIIPGYISYTNDNDLFSKIWLEIKNVSNKYNIILSLEKYFIPEIFNEKSFNILNEEQFWICLQNDICNSDFKKQAHYLLKKSIHYLFYNDSYRNYNPKFEIIYWDRNNLEEYKNSWKNFFILCEVSNEKQIHLIEPTYKLYNFLKPLHISWKNNVSKLFITHAHSAVVRLTVLHILKGQWICDRNTLVQGLNNNFLYENYDNSEFNNYLNEYISKLNFNELTLFIHQICNNNNSPIPFYYLCKSISLCEFKNFNLKYLIDLINATEKVPHLYIRKGILHCLFLCFIKLLENYNNDITNEFIKIIFLLHKNKYLHRNNTSWHLLLEFLRKENIYNNILKLKLTKEYYLLPKDYSIFIILLIDLDIIDKDWFLKYLHYIFKQQENKLEYYIFLFNTINIKTELFVNFSTNDVHNIFNDLFNICNNYENNNYSVDFFDNIEFILNSIIQNCTYGQCFEMYALFYEKLLLEKKFLCYFILIAQYVHFFEKEKIKCKEPLMLISDNFRKFKIDCDIELNNVLNKNTIKNKLLVNYYHTKLIIKKLLIEISDNYEITSEIIEKLHKYYDRGGQNIIEIVNTLYVIISNCDFKVSPNIIPEFLTLLHRCSKNIFNLRTSENFRPTITKFISVLSHPQIYQHDILKEYVYNFFLSMFDSSQTITGIRNEILCQMHLEYMTAEILTEGLLFGQILRKDQRIEFETCNIISKEIEPLKFSLSNPCELDSKVRSKSIAILLFIINDQNRNSNERNNFCETIYKKLIDKYNETAGKRYFGDSQIHVTKLRILQSLHLLICKLNKNTLCDTEEWLFNCLVNESQQPSIKILIQWLLTRIYNLLKQKDEYVKKLFHKIKNLKGTSYTSIFPIFYHMIRDKDINIETANDIITFLMPYTMGQQFSIRMSAQVTIKHIFELYSDEPEFSKKYLSIYETVTDVLNQTTSEKLNDNILTYYNLSLSIQTLYYEIPRLSNVTYTEWLPSHLFTDNICMKLKSNDGLEMLQVNKKQLQTSSTETDYDNTNVQKKIEVCNLENSPSRTIAGNLIVVASLIDKVPNLGGLSRTCEVFGVSQYVLNNIQYMRNKEYQSLSMSSEKWIDTLEVKIENLSNYLIEMKKKNYKIIGAEQTSDSKKLDTYKFNSNTVLLLGNEKEGIPPNLIHLLDDCIEIPQFGQIRSLNVHVAGSLFIWEYIKQHYTDSKLH